MCCSTSYAGNRHVQFERRTGQRDKRASSDPTDTPYNRPGLHSFQDRVASSPPENGTNKMENKINQAVRGTPEPSVSRSRSGGLEAKKLFPTSGRGRNISLDIPLYRTGVRTSLRFCFVFLMVDECYGDFAPIDDTFY